MDMEEFAQQLADKYPPAPAAVDPAAILAGAIIRELDARFPGFKAAIRQRVLDRAETETGDDDQETAELRASLVRLADHKLFME